MTFFGGVGPQMNRGAMLSGSASKTDILGKKYQPFANPFFDLASTYTPTTVKAMFGFVKHFHLTHGLINAIHMKSAQYPITDLTLTHADKGVAAKWDELMNGVLNYRVHQLETNLEYYVFGNSFTSPSPPFTKKLICTACNAIHTALRTKQQWRYDNLGFWLACPKCGQTGYAKARDDYEPRVNDITIVRWNPQNVQIFNNEATGRVDYTLDFSTDFKNQITMGRKDLAATTPQAILEAIKSNRSMVFDTRSVFHMRRAGLTDMGRWGVPLSMPVMKDVFLLQVMKKAQEAILLNHLVPQTFLFPQPATAGADPYSSVSLVDWRSHLQRELARQRLDPAYIGILPFPVGHQTIGENGKSLMLMPEIQAMSEQVCIGMGFPVDLMFGNGTYAGSSVNMRMLENFFLSNVQDHKRLIYWFMRHFSSFLGWPMPEARFKAFRMADDVQRQAALMQAKQLGVSISDTTILGAADLKFEDEVQLIASESKLRAPSTRDRMALDADLAGEAALIQAKYQARAQQAGQAAMAQEALANKSPFDEAMGSGLRGQQGYSLDAVAAALAKEIELMPEPRRAAFLGQLRSQVPEMQQLLEQQQMAGMPQPPAPGQGPGTQQGGAALPPGFTESVPGPAVDMRAQPEKLPPRRPGGV